MNRQRPHRDHAATPPYHELVEKAWILAPKTRRRPAGFVRGSDLEPEELMHFMREPGRRE